MKMQKSLQNTFELRSLELDNCANSFVMELKKAFKLLNVLLYFRILPFILRCFNGTR